MVPFLRAGYIFNVHVDQISLLTSWMRKVVKPKAAGALCNMIATKMINSTSTLERPAAAPSARPSARMRKGRGGEGGEEREREREREDKVLLVP